MVECHHRSGGNQLGGGFVAENTHLADSSIAFTNDRSKKTLRDPLIDRHVASRASGSRRAPKERGKNANRHMAIALAVLMIVSGLAVVSLRWNGADFGLLNDDERAQIKEGGPREVTYTASNFFELYSKSTDYNDRGSVDGMGLSEFWDVRPTVYPDLFIRRAYPFTMLYDYYSGVVPSPQPEMDQMGYGVYSFYRTYMDANNLTEMGTGSEKDLRFIPMLNPSGLSLDGGSLSWNWQMTYLNSQECLDIADGSHYANLYYGVPSGTVDFGGLNANDGWYTELHGTVTFDADAAVKYLGLAGSGDLRTEFNTANMGGSKNAAWGAEWTLDGDGSGESDIYCAYDYGIDDYRPAEVWLTVDPTSTSTCLVLRIWGIAWGYEILMMRFLEQANVLQGWQSYAEDMYLNGTCNSDDGDLDLRFTSVYRILAWKDHADWAAGWNLDTWHIDATPNTDDHTASAWPSHYEDYCSDDPSGPGDDYIPATTEWSPGTVFYGQEVRYWQPPEGYDLADGEKIVIELGSNPTIGYEPYVGTSDTIDAAKSSELNGTAYWGELVLGTTCYPSTIPSYYDPDTKTITIEGPVDFDAPPANPTYPDLNLSGSPQFVFGVSKVSTYELEILESGPYSPGVDYTLRVTAKNLTDAVVTDWNGTVTLSSNNAAFGSSSHLYVPGDNGVWDTTVTFSAPSDHTYINATDDWYPLDVTGGLTPGDIGDVIPEFSTVLLPVIGVALVVFMARRRKMKKDIEVR
jgi:hypothetical protein